MNSPFTLIDWAVVITYISVILFMGIHLSKQQTDTRFFFLGGRTMPVWAVALSVLATALSAATFIGVPQMSYEGDLTYLITNLGAVIAAFLIAFLFVPPIYNAGTITIYGYLGKRYGTGAMVAAGAMFLLGRLLASGARLFMAGIGLSLMLYGGANSRDLVVAVVILGIIGTAYTIWGGIRAVIWTEVFQIAVMVLAAISAVVYLKSAIPLSSSEILAHLRDFEGTNKLKLVDCSFNISNPFTLWSGLFAMTIVSLSTYGVDQDMLQRVMTARSPLHGGWALISSILLCIPVVFIFLVIGLLLHVYYARPDLMGSAAPADIIEDTRRVFPQFVLNHLPVGLRGLTMAGLISAAMSTFVSAINAMASSLVADIYVPLRSLWRDTSNDESDADLPRLKGSRLAVGLTGLSLTVFAVLSVYLQERGGESLINFALGVMAFALAPLLGVFGAALFTNRGNTRSVYASFLMGIFFVLLLQPYMVPKWTGIAVGWTWVWVIVSPLCFLICILGAPRREAQP